MKIKSYLLALTAFIGALLLGLVISNEMGNREPAGGVPGRIEQSAQATDAGIVVEVQHVDFSAGGVVIHLFARSTGDELAIAGIPPIRAELAGLHATSGHVRADGTTTLRFPAEAWADGSSTAELSITAVNTISAAAGIQPTFDQWDLLIDLPAGDAAEEARSVEALDPVTIELAGQQITVEAFLTPTETIIRYQLPPDFLVTVPQPTLEENGRMLTPVSSENDRQGMEHRFGPVQGQDALTLTFQNIVTVEPIDSPWTVRLTLEPYQIPEFSADPEVIQKEVIEWTADSTGSPPEVRTVFVRRIVDHIRLVVEFDGSTWQPGPIPPVVMGNGTSLRVAGAGNSTPNGESVSDIAIELGEEQAPTSLLITASQTKVGHPAVQVVFER